MYEDKQRDYQTAKANVKDDPMQPDAGNTEVIEGFYEWGPGVVVTADCLGATYRTGVAGRPLTVILPTFDGEKIVEPPMHYKQREDYVNVDPPNPWGEVRNFNTAADGSLIPVTICIKRVRLLLSVSSAESADQWLGPRLDEALLMPWWDALSSWIEVVTGQDLATPGERRPKRPQTFHLWGGTPDGTVRPLPMVFHGKPFPQTPVLTAAGLLRCMSAVAQGMAAPPERLHLSDARMLHNNGEWRRAVIDAATAAEVGMTSWLDANADPQVANKRRTLGKLWPVYQDLGGAVPDDFQKLVVDPRNDAAHRGMSLTREQSEAAINATATLLDGTSPIPF
jgi:hypothetical protein